jgi:hypothetical protein
MTTIETIFSKQKLANLRGIFDMSHTPTLVPIDDSSSKEYPHLMKFENGMFKTTEKIAETEIIGTFCYIAEDYFSPIYNKSRNEGLVLNDTEIDTKILRYFFPNLDFNAYSFDPVGLGLNVDGMSRISGRLYKIKQVQN